MNRNRMIQTLASLRALLFVFALIAALAPALMLAGAASAGGPITHHVSAGGPDVCEAFGLQPGCDGNFSLVAHVNAVGSMSGQYTDRWPNGDGFHAVITCVSVIGNDAWVSGVITSGTFDGEDLTGLAISTRVRDNGSSANDPPDQISLSFGGRQSRICTDHYPYPLFDAPQGQVVVK